MIDWLVFPALLVFSSVMTIAPGTNNVISFLYALRFGVRTAIIFRLGCSVTLPFVSVAVVMILKPIFADNPMILTALSYLGASVMFYIAYKIITSNPDISAKNHDMVVMGFWGGALLQLVNGKAWALAILMATTYTTPTEPLGVQAFTLWLTVLLTTMVWGLVWIYAGVYARKWLFNPANMRKLNIVLGVGMIIATLASL